MVPPIRTRPSFPHSQSLPTGSFHKLFFVCLFHTWYFTCFNAILPNLPTLSLSHRVHKTVLYISVSFAVSYTGDSYPYLSEGRQNENQCYRKLVKLITWTTALSNPMKRWTMPCSVQFSRWVVSDFLWRHGLQHARVPVHHQLFELAQSHVHQGGGAIQPSHSLLCPSPQAFNLSQHQGLFQWVSSLHQVAKVLEFQLQHQSFQWIFRTDFV